MEKPFPSVVQIILLVEIPANSFVVRHILPAIQSNALIKTAQTMKKIALFLIGMTLTALSYAQSDIVAQVTNQTWKLESDQMSGIGTHSSYPESLTIQFDKQGHWTSSSPINDASTGTWKENKRGDLLLYFGEKKKGISYVEGKSLILSMGGWGAQRKLIFAAVEKQL